MGSTYDDEMGRYWRRQPPHAHAGCYRAAGVELAGGADPHPDQRAAFARRWGLDPAHVYADYRELVARERPDIVSICTTARPRARILQDVVGAGAGVRAIWAEKPIAISLAEADEMVETCRRAGVRLAVGVTRCWDPPYTRMRDLIEAGQVGDVLQVIGLGRCTLSHNGSHLLTLVAYLAGGTGARCHWVFGHMEDDAQARGDDDLAGNGYLQFEHGVQAFVRTLPCGAADWDFEVIGTRGRLRAVADAEEVEWWQPGVRLPGGPAPPRGAPPLPPRQLRPQREHPHRPRPGGLSPDRRRADRERRPRPARPRGGHRPPRVPPPRRRPRRPPPARPLALDKLVRDARRRRAGRRPPGPRRRGRPRVNRPRGVEATPSPGHVPPRSGAPRVVPRVTRMPGAGEPPAGGRSAARRRPAARPLAQRSECTASARSLGWRDVDAEEPEGARRLSSVQVNGIRVWGARPRPIRWRAGCEAVRGMSRGRGEPGAARRNARPRGVPGSTTTSLAPETVSTLHRCAVAATCAAAARSGRRPAVPNHFRSAARRPA